MHDQPVIVSAIVSAYKCARFLPGCLDDLLAQSIMPRLEIVVVDSGSPENEGGLVAAYRERWPEAITYIRTDETETIYGAWNRGIRASRGRYVTSANADDRHAPWALERMAAVLDADPGLALVWANSLITMTENATWAEPHAVGRTDWPEFDARRLAAYCYMGPQPMWRRGLHERYGWFDRDFTSAGDYDFWLRLAAGGERFALIPDCLGLYYMRKDSLERRDKPRSRQETLLARKRNALPARERLADRAVSMDSATTDTPGGAASREALPGAGRSVSRNRTGAPRTSGASGDAAVEETGSADGSGAPGGSED